MIYKVGVSGASGKMGMEICSLLAPGYELRRLQFELADAVVGNSEVVSIEGVATRKVSEPAREPVHVWIDFSRPEATMAMLRQLTCPIVIGTTGFSESDKQQIRGYSESYPVLLTPNTSPGMAIFRRLLDKLPPSMASSFSVVVREAHHRHKQDAPSGTAKLILEILRERGFSDVPTHVTRAGSIIGTHEVEFHSDEEEISLTHRVTDRKVFAKGALEAAAFALKKAPGIYSMHDVFEENDDE